MSIAAASVSPLAKINTPAAVVDVARMEANIARMQTRMTVLGVRFRPHVKTSKKRKLPAGGKEPLISYILYLIVKLRI